MHVNFSYLFLLDTLFASQIADIFKQMKLISDNFLIVSSGAMQKNPYWIQYSVQDTKFFFHNVRKKVGK